MSNALRPYQEQDLAAILAHLEGRKSAVYQAPTGSGKTRTAAEVVKITSEYGWRVLVTVHRRELLRQMSKALARIACTTRVSPSRSS